jgi:hypothetical protein
MTIDEKIFHAKRKREIALEQLNVILLMMYNLDRKEIPKRP